MIEIKNLSHSLGDKTVLKDINLTFPENRIFGLVGVNGAGKSTLLRCMSAVYSPDNGSVLYDGLSVTDENVRREIFFLPDDPYYSIQLTCKSMFNMYKVFYPHADVNTYKRLICEFKLDEKKPLNTFSKGMRRQAYIVCALAIAPKYLLLDEAFDGLDPYTRKKVKAELISLTEEKGSTVIISSHSLRELESLCDSFVLLDNNTVSSYGDVSEKVNEMCKFQLAFLSEISESAFDNLPVVSLEKNGKFIRVVLQGDRDTMYNSLLKLSPAVIEEMKMDFEEAVISEIERSARK
ncbi:MAG: ABC transporter ATP-binding protein [Clostridia bacterium]|nr:ABC transporter ATP-binding protein [Clostridia bacterium]